MTQDVSFAEFAGFSPRLRQRGARALGRILAAAGEKAADGAFVVVLLEAAAEAVEQGEAAGGLPAGERAAWRAVGADLEAERAVPRSRARAAAAFATLVQASIGGDGAMAAALGVDRSRISQRLAERSLYAFPGPAKRCFPRWQLLGDRTAPRPEVGAGGARSDAAPAHRGPLVHRGQPRVAGDARGLKRDWSASTRWQVRIRWHGTSSARGARREAASTTRRPPAVTIAVGGSRTARTARAPLPRRWPSTTRTTAAASCRSTSGAAVPPRPCSTWWPPFGCSISTAGGSRVRGATRRSAPDFADRHVSGRVPSTGTTRRSRGWPTAPRCGAWPLRRPVGARGACAPADADRHAHPR